MTVQKIQSRSIKDISHFFFSSSSLKTNPVVAKAKSYFSRLHQFSSSEKFENPLGWVVSKIGVIAPNPFSAATTYAEKNGLGFVVVDQDMIVHHINATAKQFLSLQQQEFVGHVFDFFIMPNEKQNISITRQDGQPGIGRMSVRDNGNSSDQLFYIILIEDVALKDEYHPLKSFSA